MIIRYFLACVLVLTKFLPFNAQGSQRPDSVNVDSIKASLMSKTGFARDDLYQLCYPYVGGDDNLVLDYGLEAYSLAVVSKDSFHIARTGVLVGWALLRLQKHESALALLFSGHCRKKKLNVLLDNKVEECTRELNLSQERLRVACDERDLILERARTNYRDLIKRIKGLCSIGLKDVSDPVGRDYLLKKDVSVSSPSKDGSSLSH